MQYGSNGNSDKRNGEKRKRDLGKCTLRLNLYPESVRIKHRLILNHSGREKFVRSSILSLEEKLHRFVEKNLFRIGVLLILLCSFFVRYHLAPITVLSGDYNISLLPWVESYRASGIVKGLSQVIGNYYVPYNLFLAVIAQLPGQPWAYIAYLSILCDYLVAWFIYLIARNLMSQWGGNMAAGNR